MNRQAWLLFAAMSIIWGLPYLFIKIALDEVSPPVVVFARVALAVVLLLPITLMRGQLRGLWPSFGWIAAFGILEIGLPWLMVNHAEMRISSGVTGLLLATVPLVGSVVAWLLGDRGALSKVRIIGLAAGLTGVGLLVGIDGISGSIDIWSVVELILVAACYAIAPMIVVRKLSHLPIIGVVTMSLAVVGVLYLVPGVIGLSQAMPLEPRTIMAIAVLGIVCTALAFLFFFRLIEAAGPVRATVITFINPAVAIALGAIILSETITTGMWLGFPLVILGSFLATRPTRRGADVGGTDLSG